MSSPVVADGVVYVGSDGTLSAFAVGCNIGGGTCAPLWIGDGLWEHFVACGCRRCRVHRVGTAACMPSPSAAGVTVGPVRRSGRGSGAWIASSPVVADGVVYVGSGHGSLYAFEVGCNRRRILPAAVDRPDWDPMSNPSSPAVADGVVYVGSGNGNLYAFAEGCRSDGGPCPPLWVGRTGDSILSSPAVADGVVYVGSTDGKLYAFAVGCRSDGGACPRSGLGRPAPRSTRLLRSRTVSCTSAPATVTCTPSGSAAGATAGGARRSGRRRSGRRSRRLRSRMAWSTSGRAQQPVRLCHRLPVPTAGPARRLDVARWWQVDLSSPAVSNGVVYVSSGDGQLYAFDLLHGDVTPPVITSGPRVGVPCPRRSASGPR